MKKIIAQIEESLPELEKETHLAGKPATVDESTIPGFSIVRVNGEPKYIIGKRLSGGSYGQVFTFIPLKKSESVKAAEIDPLKLKDLFIDQDQKEDEASSVVVKDKPSGEKCVYKEVFRTDTDEVSPPNEKEKAVKPADQNRQHGIDSGLVYR